MKVVDLSPLSESATKDEKSKSWLTHLQMIAKYGWHWYRSYQAEEKIIRVLSSVLDQRFVLIRGLKTADDEKPLPLILAGPPGVHMVYVWPKSGIYRIREGQWEVMQGKSRRYRPDKTNVVKEVLRLNHKVATFVSDALGRPVKVTPLMVFSDTGADVAAVRPAVRPLLIDGLKRYAAQLGKQETQLTPTDLMALVEAARPRPIRLTKTSPRSRQTRKKLPSQAPRQAQRAARRLNFTPRQWLILGVLAFAVLAISMAAIVYVLMTAY